jgi:hypothetical protein
MSEQTMIHQSSNLWQAVQDADTIAWLSADSNEARELIVEAKLPARKILMQERGGRSVPAGIDAKASAERAAVLTELYDFLAEQVDIPPVLLKAAGAIAVRATGQQARQFANHPLIKSIRPNRKLGQPRAIDTPTHG